MQLRTQKRLAADVLKVGAKRVEFDTERLEEIAEAITKEDIRGLIKDGAIRKKPEQGISRVRARKRIVQRRKGRQQGAGTRKGTANARTSTKSLWMNRIRSQRDHLRTLREEGTIAEEDFRSLYRKAKGGFFRSRRHINLYIDEHDMRKTNGND